MVHENKVRSKGPFWYDRDSSYGWISILLHWSTAVVLIYLWYIGKSIAFTNASDVVVQRSLHISVAATVWLLLVVRIVWRLGSGHPHVKNQSPSIHRVARLAHYTLLTAALLMLLSGPLIVWGDGHAIDVFDWLEFPGPFAESAAIAGVARFVHAKSSLALLFVGLLHIAGAVKHLMFHDDETFIRMLIPDCHSDIKTSDTGESVSGRQVRR